jgi:hypothetical protein
LGLLAKALLEGHFQPILKLASSLKWPIVRATCVRECVRE